ncbi:fumarylacetoacetase [Candidatus Uabimicrobium sp. HlEnr_7]|uniref:fumarylacetoacetase n=1 Tax=Candidatus Uabimicrobium helgolandensis TaxID=3095367 RepID=UPI0035570C7D
MEENNPNLKSWITVAADSDFPIQNLPFGVFSYEGNTSVGVAIGDKIVHLGHLYDAGLMSDTVEKNVFAKSSLNPFLMLGKKAWRSARKRVSELLREDNAELKGNNDLRQKCIIDQNQVTMKMPVEVASFVDFYSSIEHATNIGSMFRPNNPLMPNWKHLPVGYNGRSSSVVVSGTSVVRPKGQIKADDAEVPSFGASKLLDIELEMGFITGPGKPLSQTIPTAEALDYVFGMVLLNDWSARDIQKWEYVPLGPFLGKSFATSISPWIVTMDALEPFRASSPKQDPPVLPHLQFEGDGNYNIHLEAHIKTEKMDAPMCMTKTNFQNMYWNIPQQLAHVSSNGTNIEAGDVYGSGTVSGTTPDSLGSMLELCWRGTRPLKLPSGEERKFLLDGDEVTLKGWCQGDGYRVGFGKCHGKILPAID